MVGLTKYQLLRSWAEWLQMIKYQTVYEWCIDEGFPWIWDDFSHRPLRIQRRIIRKWFVNGQLYYKDDE